MTTLLRHLAPLAVDARKDPLGKHVFFDYQDVVNLRWPRDVVDQWLFDHAGNESFERDYGHIDLEQIAWSIQVLPTPFIVGLPTGASDAGCIESYAEDPEHWVRLRNSGIHVGVREMWETRGTWKRWPLLIDRALVDDRSGLQVVEGRTRVGVLKGRLREGRRVAGSHLCWVGRVRPSRS